MNWSSLTRYRPFAAYFGWTLISIALYVVALVLLRYFNVKVPTLDSIPPDALITGFFVRMWDSDYEMAVTVLFAATLFYSAAQFGAVARDEEDIPQILARSSSTSTFGRTVTNVAAGRNVTLSTAVAEAFAEKARWKDVDARRIGIIEDHIRYGGAAAAMPLRFALWLFPMLGFLGTVIGLSSAVNNLAGVVSGSGAAGLRDASLQAVLKDLHLAFDTTIQGIVFAVVVILLLAALDRSWTRLTHGLAIYKASRLAPEIADEQPNERTPLQ